MTNSEKFQELTLIYPNIFVDADHFANRLGNKRATSVYNWLNSSNPNGKNRAKIAEIFNLKVDIWMEEFFSKKSFHTRIKSGEFNVISKVDRSKENIDRYIYHNKEEEKVEMLDSCNDMENPLSLFECAKRLKSEDRAKEALELIKKIEDGNWDYKYNNHNKIEHLKAILLSHKTIEDWDGALDILKTLYSSSKYHLEKPEIVTLIASNYKRKALSSRRLEEIDIDLLVQAYSIYKEAYKLKDSQERYYDAINFAYIHNIIDVIEPKYADKREIDELYRELKSVWRIDKSSWWEVSSDCEFLMLLGNVNLAISNINYFFDFNTVTRFDIETTIRQLKLYIDFTKDKSAIMLYDHLKESMNYLAL